MKNTKRFLTAFASLFIILCLYSTYFAQQRDPSRGFQSANSYAAGNFDAVNVSNGNVIINLPLASLPAGRGTSPGFTVTLQYNSKLWDAKQTDYSNHLQQGSGDQNNTSGDYFYSADRLQLSDRGGWRVLSYYQLIETNRLNLASPDPCNGGSIDEYNARWKLEMELPDGSVKQFIPVYNALKTKDGYYDVNVDGTRYNYVTQTNPGNGLCYVGGSTVQMTTGGMTYMTTDGSRLRLFVPYQPSQQFYQRNWAISSPDGTVIENAPPDDATVSQRISDRNGSKIEIKGNQIVDQLGRSITIDGNGVTFKGVGGEDVTTQMVWGNRWVHRGYTAIENNPGEIVPQGTEPSGEVNVGFPTIEQVILPTQAGGQSYSFEYYADATQQFGTSYTDGWGELKSVTLPTGAKATYTYDRCDGTGCRAFDILERHATTRDMTYTDSYDGGQTQRTETTSYHADNYSNGVSDPGGASSHDYVFYNQYMSEWNSGLAYRTYASNGLTVERIWKYNLPNYANNPYPSLNMRPGNSNAYVKTEFTSIVDAAGQYSLTAIKDYNYDKNGNVLEIREYDWVPYGSIPRDGTGTYSKPTGLPANINNYLKRKTVNTYYNQAPEADSTATSSYTYENPNSPKLKNVIKSTEIQNAGGTPISRSEFFYDDPDNKGNLTETRTWDSYKDGSTQAYSNPLTTGNSVSTTISYNSYGSPTLTTDAKGNQTQITYGAISGPNGTVTDLYPTQIVSAYGTAIQQTVQSEYDFYTGLVKKTTALGNTAAENVSSETVYEALGRPLISKAATGTASEIWTQIEYNDVDRRVITKSDLFAKGDGKKVSTQFYDQLGRVRLSKTLEDSATQSATNETDGIKVQTRYQTGNPYSYQLASNPYRAATATGATSEPSMGWTRSKSTNTGRHSEVETFAGASLPAPWGTNTSSSGIVSTDIDVERTLVTDQSGKQRISKTNALGQMTDVWEVTAPDASTVSVSFPNQTLSAGYQTSYQYDALNNLTTVNQGVQQPRSFAYSSLSRLLSAQNPESGTINYQYDAGGNLTQKTDARSVNTNYAYDALNRVTARSYSDSTPAVSYFYDNLQNARGKLIKVSSATSTTEYTGFDIVGRVLSHKQTTDGNAYTTAYNYNLSGALVEETYPSGRVVKNVLDNNGYLELVQSKKNQNSGYWSYAKSFTYTAAGAVSSMQLGNGKWESTQFNSRLQPMQIALGTIQNGTDKLNLVYTYNSANNPADNNGNVRSQTINVPAVGSNGGFTATQTYAYDALNRLQSAAETIPNQQGWQQTFTYDRYGNRNFDTANTTTLGSCSAAQCNPSIDAANNRFTTGQGYTYDLSGNVVTDAQGRTFNYDAENKQKSVSNSGTSIGTYFYDGDGKRVKKITNSETTIFVYDAQGKLVAEYSNQTSQTPQVSYLTQDNLGTPRINTDQNGNVIARHDYLPFGEEIDSSVTAIRNVNLNYGDDGIKKKFTGYTKDDETDLDFAQARMYANRLGRFTSVDTGAFTLADPQNFNRYSYVQNSPVKFTDPTGKDIYLNGNAADDFLDFLKTKSGLDLTRDTKTGKVTITKGSKQSGGSKEFAKLLKNVIGDSAKLTYEVKQSESTKATLYDNGEDAVVNTQKKTVDGVIDFEDIKETDKQAPELAATVVGHFLYEGLRLANGASFTGDMAKGFTSLQGGAHLNALVYETKILSEYTGQKETLAERRDVDYPKTATINFIYNSVQYDVVIKSTNTNAVTIDKITKTKPIRAPQYPPGP